MSALPTVPNDDLTPLEQDVLDEYERLAENMKKVGRHVFTTCPSRNLILIAHLDIARESP